MFIIILCGSKVIRKTKLSREKKRELQMLLIQICFGIRLDTSQGLIFFPGMRPFSILSLKDMRKLIAGREEISFTEENYALIANALLRYASLRKAERYLRVKIEIECWVGWKIYLQRNPKVFLLTNEEIASTTGLIVEDIPRY